MSASRPDTIAITSGEPAGIGPDLCVLIAGSLAADTNTQYALLADAELLAARADALGLKWPVTAGNVRIEHVPLATQAKPGDQSAKALPVFSHIYGFRRCAKNFITARLETFTELERRLSPKLHDNAKRLLYIGNFAYIFKR